jgi:hypothetical protein
MFKIKFYDNLRATRAERVGGSLRRGYQFRSGTYTRALTLVPEVYFYYFHCEGRGKINLWLKAAIDSSSRANQFELGSDPDCVS